MAAANTVTWRSAEQDSQIPAKRSFKPSDLPLTSMQRTSIDALVSTLKKRGGFDALRKTVLEDYSRGVIT